MFSLEYNVHLLLLYITLKRYGKFNKASESEKFGLKKSNIDTITILYQLNLNE